MYHNRKLTISVANSRKTCNWQTVEIYWSELVEKLKTPVRGTETLEQYLSLSKARQDDLKDVGGFVGGLLKGSRRKADNVINRDIIALDMDNIAPGQTLEILKRLEGLGCAYAVYSTRKHEEARPRLRVLFPLNRSASPDEYEPLARKTAAYIGIELCDPSTFQVHRLMYWPSVCSAGRYVYQYADKPFLSVDETLAQYTDWKDMSSWPTVPGIVTDYKKLAARQGDPTAKSGTVGAFCKVYDIHKVLNELIPGIYEHCTISDRYTYIKGSTTGGAVVYEAGKFLYSHHATDPAGDRLSNAFDLVRLHKFGYMDEGVKPDTPANKLPSYQAMCTFALNDKEVAALINKERYEKAAEAFSTEIYNGANTVDDFGWLKQLKFNPTSGRYDKTSKNIRVILENDPNLKGKIRLNTFSSRIICQGPLPWRRENKVFNWADSDDSNLREYIENLLGFRSREMVQDALINHALANSFNPVQEYLKNLVWDGKPRLDTLFIDYLGAADSDYVRAATRKSFVAAIARAMQPGIKFDTMTVIEGRQGIYKSTLFNIMAGEWFSDSQMSFEGKEALENIQGKWIIEISELKAFKKTGVNTIKQFLSKTCDYFRVSYGRYADDHPRKCVFFGTTNDKEYLNDPTGGRRFWPIEVDVHKPTKKVPSDLPKERDQIWAEAYCRYQLGESLYLKDELLDAAIAMQEQYTEVDPLKGQIEDFLEQPIPDNWYSLSAKDRELYFYSEMKGETSTMLRDRICALEIWRECLQEKKTMSKADSARINNILRTLPGWEESSRIRFGEGYGRQRGFVRQL